MKINAKDIVRLLPERLRRDCQVGICVPSYLERKRPVFCHIPILYGGPRWSARPSDVWPKVKSIITLIHFTPIAQDYSVHGIALELADILWQRLGVKTHVLNRRLKSDKKNLVGDERSFLEATGYDAHKKMILFKDIAYYAGLGQYGRNSLIINNRFGSNFKIQALFTEAELKCGQPMRPRAYPGCQNCKICLQACPEKIIYNYKVVTKTDACRFLLKTKPVIIGRLPKTIEIWNKSHPLKKLTCRICQSFCPANARHYLKQGLILVRRDDKRKIVFSYAKG